jgi:hypothetical protein
VNPAQLLAIPVFMIALALVWLIAELSRRKGLSLVRLLLVVQFLLLAAVLVFCVSAKPSSNPHGMLALVAALIAVTAMACQYALLRLALPKAISTAVTTGNLTNTVLSIMDAISRGHPLMSADDGRLKRSLYLLFGFLLGCIIAAMAISTMGEWAPASLELAEQFPRLSQPTTRGRDLFGVSAVPEIAVTGASGSATAGGPAMHPATAPPSHRRRFAGLARPSASAATTVPCLDTRAIGTHGVVRQF